MDSFYEKEGALEVFALQDEECSDLCVNAQIATQIANT